MSTEKDAVDVGFNGQTRDGQLGANCEPKRELQGQANTERIAESEEMILLRQTDDGKLSAPSSKNRGQQKLQQNQNLATMSAGSGGLNEDANSLTTTTSDVNSDDDAASIVSRLSQIVVEQEGKLVLSTNSMLDNDLCGFSSKLSQENGGTVQRRRSLTASTNRNASVVPMSRVKSSNDCVEMHEIRCEVPLGDDCESSLPELGKRCERNQLTDQQQDLSKSGSENLLPQIQVTGDEFQTRDVIQNRKRAKSAFSMRPNADGDENRAPMRRNESSGYVPERGDLRSLESNRFYHQATTRDAEPKTRDRSNTAGSDGKPDLLKTTNGQLVLNIRRSTWTLSEFDQTFNRSGDKLTDTSNSVSSDLDGSGADSCEAYNQMGKTSNLDRRNCSNLMILASKNAINLRQNQQSPIGSSNSVGLLSPTSATFDGKLKEDAHRHSIVSFASLQDSLYGGSKNLTARGRSRSFKYKNGDGENEDFEVGKCACLRSYCNLATIGQYIPIIEWLPAYNMSLLWGDLMAGMVVAVLNISTSLSAAVVAETELSVAFRASIVNTFVYAILCSSRHTSFGSWSIMSQMLLVSVQRALSDELILDRLNLGPSASWAPEEYERLHLNIIIMYTFLIGLVQLICGLLNLGNILASFIPEALCSSMIAATAFVMAVGQLANMCGTSNKLLWSIERNTTELWADLKDPPLDITDLFADLFRWAKQIALLVKHNDQINLVCVVISSVSVILLFLNQYVIQPLLERFFRRKVLIPIEMILLVLMIIASYLLDLKEKYRVATCGAISIDFVIPNLPNFGLIRELWYQSLATALISYTMVYIMAKTYSNKMNYEVDCNQELIACGAGNLVGGLFDALPATASFSRTAGQVEAGGRTQMASIVNCILLVVLAQLLGHHVAHLPVCVMAATLFFGFVRMMSRFSEVITYWRICKVDFAIWTVSFVAILTVDLVNGFVYGFIFSILTMLYRAQK